MRFGHLEQLSLQQLGAEALAGSPGAALALANRASGCKTLTEFLDLYVPADDVAGVFDTFADAWQESRARATRDTLPMLGVVKREEP